MIINGAANTAFFFVTHQYIGATNCTNVLALLTLQHHCIGETVLVASIVSVQTQRKKWQKC
jgi:hypothetical protein